MKMVLYVLTIVLEFSGLLHSQTAPGNAQELLGQLQQETTTKQAVTDLKNVAQSDAKVRSYLAKYPPGLLGKVSNQSVWESEGDLRVI